MPRRWIKKFAPHPHALLQRWPLRVFGPRLSDPKLWTLHRRGVTAGFGAGLAICFMPIPVHLPLATLTGEGLHREITMPRGDKSACRTGPQLQQHFVTTTPLVAALPRRGHAACRTPHW